MITDILRDNCESYGIKGDYITVIRGLKKPIMNFLSVVITLISGFFRIWLWKKDSAELHTRLF